VQRCDTNLVHSCGKAHMTQEQKVKVEAC
jgi:hypothetical protein